MYKLEMFLQNGFISPRRGLIRISFTGERRYKKLGKKGRERRKSLTRAHTGRSFFFSRMKCPVHFFFLFPFFFFYLYRRFGALFLFLSSVGREMMSTTSRPQGYWKKALTLKDPRNQMYKISVAVYTRVDAYEVTPTDSRLHHVSSYTLCYTLQSITASQPGLEK